MIDLTGVTGTITIAGSTIQFTGLERLAIGTSTFNSAR